MKSLTLRQLAHYRGHQNRGKIYVAIRGEVFDVTISRYLYGEGGVYEVLAGCEIARALAMFELDEVGSCKTDDLSIDQIVALKEWIEKFRVKYKRVGEIVEALPSRCWKAAYPIAAFAIGAVAFTCLFLRKR